jgi:hypothetical protein
MTISRGVGFPSLPVKSDFPPISSENAGRGVSKGRRGRNGQRRLRPPHCFATVHPLKRNVSYFARFVSGSN